MLFIFDIGWDLYVDGLGVGGYVGVFVFFVGVFDDWVVILVVGVWFGEVECVLIVVDYVWFVVSGIYFWVGVWLGFVVMVVGVWCWVG